jgi:hypothetical protein
MTWGDHTGGLVYVLALVVNVVMWTVLNLYDENEQVSDC